MTMCRTLTAARLAVVTAGFVALGAASAVADHHNAKQDAGTFVPRGTLTCTVAAGMGKVIASSKALTCSFAVKGQKAAHRYTGEINKLGVDIGFTEKSQLVWAVYANPKTKLTGKLSGSYTGLSAEVTAGLGVSAKALVGEQKEIALQPVKLDGQTGLNVAAGVTSVKLVRQK